MRLYYLAQYEYCKKENCAELTDRLTLLKAETHLSGAAVSLGERPSDRNLVRTLAGHGYTGFPASKHKLYDPD